MKILISLICLMLCSTSLCAATQDHRVLQDHIAAFIEQQAAGMAGKISYHVENIDPRLSLEKCEHIEVFLPSGTQLLGRVSIGSRCIDTQHWTIFVPVQIKISRELMVSTRQLSSGHVVQAEDLQPQMTELTQSGGISDATQIIGKVVRSGIAVGQLLREDMLREPYSVTQGQQVKLVILANGFNISSSGVALSNASQGQVVKVKSESGNTVSGFARIGGIVEITP